MGGLYFAVYNDLLFNADFVSAFMRMKSRGLDDTSFETDTSPAINQSNYAQAQSCLTRREIQTYKPINYTYGYHHTKISDTSDNYLQPFSDPKLHKMSRYPDLRTRPPRKLMCNGVIYNYRDLVETEGFTDHDLDTSSDVEVIMPLYIRHGIQGTLDRLEGAFSFVLTENTMCIDTRRTKVYVARDPMGLRSLWMVSSTDPKRLFYMFVSDPIAVPEYILLDTSNYKIIEVPPGSLWTLETHFNATRGASQFLHFKVDPPTEIKYILPTPDQLSRLYNEITVTLTKAVLARYPDDVSTGILLSDFDSLILLGILLKEYPQNTFQLFTMGHIKPVEQCIELLRKQYPEARLIHHRVIPSSKINTGKFDDLVKYISGDTDVKVVLTGHYLDELFTDNPKLVKNYDYYPVELRFPFSDLRFRNLLAQVSPKIKAPQRYDYTKPPIDKYIVRKAFDIDYKYLPQKGSFGG